MRPPAAAAQVATLDTRQAKQDQQDEPDLRARWQLEARTHGIPDGWWTELLDRQVEQRHGLAPLLVEQDTLTEHTASSAHRDVIRTIAEHADDGAHVREVLEVARIMGRTSLKAGEWIPLDPDSGRGPVDVIRRADGTTVDAAGGDRRFTTRRLLALEQQTVSVASARRDHAVAIVPEPVLTAALSRRPTLGDDQGTMVRRLTTDGDGVTVVVGKAGTGRCRPAHASLGPPPDDPAEHDRWARTAFAVEQYRLRWDITDPHHTLGDQPTDPLQRADYLQAALTITRHLRETEQAREVEQHLEIDGPELGRNIGLSR